MKRIIKKIIGIFFPKVCPCCGKIIDEKEELCDQCKNEVEIIGSPRCNKCGKALQGEERIFCQDCGTKKHLFDKGISVFVYRGKIRDSIHQFKYHNAREFVEYYGDVAWKNCGKQLKEWKPDCIVPVPMYRKKEVQRGYNQAELFGRYIAKKSGFPIETNLLIRKKNTKPQKGLTDEKRQDNLKRAFAINLDRIKGIKTVLLVDDIYTTGSTMDVCAGILKKAGAEKVFFLCIAAGKDYEKTC